MKEKKKKKSIWKIIFKTLLTIVAIVLVAAIGLFTWLTITEFKPADVEPAELVQPENGTAFSGNKVTLLSMNVGYCALGKDSDFFMDGGKEVRPDSKTTIETNLKGIENIIAQNPADFVFLQEVDTDSMRSYYINEKETVYTDSGYAAYSYALNYSCGFVPFPLPPIGKVESGLLTMSNYGITQSDRISLPCPFSWPVSTANLKRCLLISRIPIEGSDKELVLINLHLEAYDDGEGKIAQTRQLLSVLEEEYAKGNYVIAGGDFNQLFPGTEAQYPNEHPDLWKPGALENDTIPTGWQYAFDPSTPTCRLLNQPYDPADTANTQYYVIDGFIVSPNVSVERVETLNEGFVCSDHNPVLLSLTLN